MATMIIGGEKYQMPIWLKARLLDLRPSKTPSALEVESGSERGKYYTVKHNGTSSTFCPCDAHIDGCAHRVAVNNYLEKQQAKKQNELDGAAVVAPLVLGSFSQDLQAHLDDEMPVQEPEPDAFDCVYGSLVFGTINTLEDIVRRSGLVERELITNALEVLRSAGRIVVRKVERGVYWIDTPAQSYRATYPGDYAA